MFTSIFTIAPAEQWECGSQKVSFPWDSQGSGVLSSMHLLIAINISYLNQSVLMNQEVSQRCWQPLGLPKVSLYASYIARNLMTSHSPPSYYSLCTCWHYQPWLHKNVGRMTALDAIIMSKYGPGIHGMWLCITQHDCQHMRQHNGHQHNTKMTTQPGAKMCPA